MKKLTALLLALSLSTAVLAGCTPAAEKPVDSTDPSAAASPLEFSVTTVNFGEEPTGKEIQNAWLAKCEELMGRKIVPQYEFINISDYSEKLKILMAGGDLPDVVSAFGLPNSDVIKYGEQGVIEDLTQYKDKMPNYMKYVDKDENSKKAAYSAEGKLFSFYGVQVWDTPTGYTTYQSAVRGDILEKHKLSYPTTIEEFYQVAKVLKAEYPDMYPVVQLEEWAPIDGVLLASNHSSSDRYFNGKKFVYGPLEEGYKEALMEMKQWYDEGLIAPDFFAHTQAEGMASLAGGTAFMIPNIYTEYPGLWVADYPDQTWVLLDGLKNEKYGNPWNRTKVNKDSVLQNGNGMVISSSAKEKEDLVEFMDLQYNDDVAEILSWGLEGKTFTVNEEGERELLPEFKGGESSDTLIQMALPASGRCRAGISQVVQNMTMLWDNFNPVCKIYNGKEVVESQNSVYSRTVEGEVHPNEYAPPITLPDAENQEYANIMTAVETFVKEAKVQFINGERSFDDWDKYLEEINSMGDIDQAMELYNSKL